MKHVSTPFNLLTKQAGYSIVEWMVVVMLTLFLTAALLTIFVSSKKATTESLNRGERQENGAFALQILSRDLKQAYFFAQATGDNKNLWDLNSHSLAISLDCIDNIGSGTFPSTDNYRQLWASTVPTNEASLKMTCINDSDNATSLITDTGFISIKRARGLSQSVDFQSNRYYLAINPAGIKVYLADENGLITGGATPLWQYIHHVYYLDNEDDIPRLRRIHLEKNGMVKEEPLVEGIENMQFMFALDNLIASERDGSIHAFVAASQVTDTDWDSGRVIGIKIYVLARSLTKTPGYINNDTYQLGTKSFTAPGDAYKRELASRVVTFQNSVVLVDD